MEQYKTVFVNGQTYMPLNVIANAFCLESNLVEDLVMTKDKQGTVEIIDDKVMVPFDVFKKIKFPQDEYFFRIVAAYLKGSVRKRKE